MYKQKIAELESKISKRGTKIWELRKRIRRLEKIKQNSEIELEKYKFKEKNLKYITIKGLEEHEGAGFQSFNGLIVNNKEYTYLSDIVKRYNFDSAIIKYELISQENTGYGFRVGTFTKKQLLDMDQEMKKSGNYGNYN